MSTVAKEICKCLIKGTGRVITGALIIGIGSALARTLAPISDHEGKKLYKSIYGEEPPKRTVKKIER